MRSVCRKLQLKKHQHLGYSVLASDVELQEAVTNKRSKFVIQSIFISSSGDLKDLRKSLRNDLHGWLDQHGFGHLLRPYLWEEDKEDGRLLSDRQRIQSQLPDPASPDVPLTICLFGERCGSPLEDELDPLVNRRFDRWRADGDGPGLLHPWPRDPEAQDRALAFGQYPLTGTVFELLSAHSQPEEADNLIIASIVDRPIMHETSADSVVLNERKLFGRLTDGRTKSETSLIEAEIYDPQATALLNLLKDHARRVRFVSSYPSEADMRREVLTIAQEKLRQKLGIASLRNPFKQSLAHWTVDEEKQLPGRADGIRDVLAAMNNRGDLVLLKGRSGCGKSSLMQCGIMRRLREIDGSIPIPFRPTELMAVTGEGDALERLAWLIAEAGDVPFPAGGPMAMRPENYAKRLCTALEKNHVDVVLGLDQFEEIIDELKLEKGLSTGTPQRGWWLALRFLKILCTSPSVRIVATLESARETSFQELGIGQALGLMPKTINVDATDDTVAEIARSGFARGGLPLDTEVVEAIKRKWRAFEQETPSDNASPLPLACLFFHRLYERFADLAGATPDERTKSAFKQAGQVKGDRLLTLEEIGGEGAIAFAGIVQDLADEAWRVSGGAPNFPKPIEKCSNFNGLDNFLKPLVTIDHDGLIQLRAAVEVDADTSTINHRRAFRERRLLVPVPGAGPLRLRPMHQAIFDHWSPAKRWLAHRKNQLQAIHVFREEAIFWNRRGKSVPVKEDGSTMQAAVLTLAERFLDWRMQKGGAFDADDAALQTQALAVFDDAEDPLVVIESDPFRKTYAHLAAFYHRVELLRRFISTAPECLMVEDRDGENLLHKAAWSHGPAVPFLLSEGVPPTTDKYTWNAISSAISENLNGNFDAMIGQINLDDPIETTSDIRMIHFAARNGNTYVIEYLTEHGADLSLQDQYGETALHEAARADQVTAFQYLLQHIDIRKQDNSNRTAISTAASSGSAKVLSNYLAEEADPDRLTALLHHRDRWADTPLLISARHRHPEALYVLMQSDLGELGNPSSAAHITEDGDTLLHRVFLQEYGSKPTEEERFRARAVVELLLRDGRLDPNQPNNKNQTPFDIAGAFPEARRALRQDDRIPKDYAKMTPAMRIEDLSSRRPATVLRLLEAAPQALEDEHVQASEPNAGIPDRPRGKLGSSMDGSKGETGLDILLRLKNHSVLSILADGDIHWPTLRARLAELLAVAAIPAAAALRDALMRRAAAGAIEPREAEELLGAVVDADDRETAKALVSQGVSPKLRVDDEGNTILHRAAISGDLERFRSLLAIGLFAVPHDGWGRCPSDLAAESMAEDFRALEAEMEDPREAQETFAVASAIADQAPFLSIERVEAGRDADETEIAVLQRDWKGGWGDIDTLDIRSYDLPFHPNVPLIELRPRSTSSAAGRLCFLIHDDKLFRLNGTSPPIHEVNGLEAPEINEETVLQYLAFFCFFVRGEEGPFLIVDRSENGFIPDLGERHDEITNAIRAPRVWGRNEEGNFRVSGLVYYSNAGFFSNFIVQPSGMIEMISDAPILTDLPAGVDAPVEIRTLH
ncbi:ankyrin repeat domain-containing protein [Tritonibacter scottomollicae]|uniref:Ankyrin repeat protein n=1 Tax=Tritonibacter scottomollicae TaxID=483013 RepID=A0A2T1A5E5_TRISK|nr:ankyrin repeat domain-containing protein [Tritonibacter scottomollicae]PRZ43819.1 ankyrin repeat protein [Tritonibacter scottomollicae]